MPYGEIKVYRDGSHYITIPCTSKPEQRKKQKPIAFNKEISITGDGSAKEPDQLLLDTDTVKSIASTETVKRKQYLKITLR